MLISFPVATLSFFIGINATIFFSELPPFSWCFALALCVFVCAINFPNRCLALLFATFCGFSYMTLNIEQHKLKQLPYSLENQQIKIKGTIVSIPEYENNKTKFRFNVEQVIEPVGKWLYPGQVQLCWISKNKNLQVGDQWLLNVKLRMPRNYANPGCFDSEKYFFQQHVHATGFIVAIADNHLIDSSKFRQPMNKLRQYLLAQISNRLEKQEFIGILLALVLGLKNSIPINQWEIFRDTGTAHLMAISGLHIGLVASLVFWSIRFLGLWLPGKRELMPIPIFAAICALLITSFYALLAGFSISTQRALIMVVVFLLAILWRRKIPKGRSYFLALAAVLVWDPFSVLSAGFWLSFAAVGVLMYSFHGRQRSSQWFKSQWVIGIGLIPVSVAFFQQLVWISPLVNILAIPWVSFLVVPFALLGITCLLVYPPLGMSFLEGAQWSFAKLWSILLFMAQLGGSGIKFPELTWYQILLAMLGCLWILAPRGIPGKWVAFLCFLPMVWPHTKKLEHGDVEFTVLDVGQGLATVIQTKSHILVYDTGDKLSDRVNMGSQVLIPYFKAKGIQQVDTLVISHGDRDHAGGAAALLEQMPVKNILTSDRDLLRLHKPELCEAGNKWNWDGVMFEFLHPNSNMVTETKRNNRSCVLQIRSASHRLLLTGDIETKIENELISNYGESLQSDILLVPHHGSRTSSSALFLQFVAPKYALFSVGHLNKYGHPKEDIVQRYRDFGSVAMSTEKMGAINIKLISKNKKISAKCYRIDQHRFWHEELR